MGSGALLNSLQPFTTQSNKKLELSFWENQAPHVGNRRGLSPKLTVGQWMWALQAPGTHRDSGPPIPESGTP